MNRSIDSLDALEESDLDEKVSNRSSETPSEVDSVENVKEDDLDLSCDSYGVRKETNEPNELFEEGDLSDHGKKLSLRHVLLLKNFEIIEKNVVLTKSQSCDLKIEASKVDRRASLVPVIKPNLEDLIKNQTFIRRGTLSPALVMQATRLSLSKVNSYDFDKASSQVRERAKTVIKRIK